MDSLQIQPNTIGYEGIPLQVWSVKINHQRISDRAAPFTADSESIHSSICAECYAASRGQIASCSAADISVRRYGNVIYWFLADPETNSRLQCPLLWSFPQAEYERQLSGSATSLPGFDSADIQCLLSRSHILPRDSGLYTIPDLPGDSQGRELLAVIEKLIASGGFSIAAPPEQVRNIRVGCELPGVPECIVEVGLSAGSCAVRFVENPTFPLWVTAEQMHVWLSRYLP